ncbi:uncharacterized protein LOC141906307 [Tubulanus polymorphus]|uniref:uncharacterized protein LOC141906307 n=1 Tax=Tubulanus polymorphus TaxID=672921 RepID=UPI003DA40574
MADRLVISDKGTLTLEPSELPPIDQNGSLVARGIDLYRPVSPRPGDPLSTLDKVQNKKKKPENVVLPKIKSGNRLLSRYDTSLEPEGINFSEEEFFSDGNKQAENGVGQGTNAEALENGHDVKTSGEYGEQKSESDQTADLAESPEKDGTDGSETSLNRQSPLAAVPKKMRFKKLARMVRTNLFWRRELNSGKNPNEEERGARDFVIHNKEDGTTEVLTFNLQIFKAKGQSYGGLTAKAKRICMKAHWERTNEDLACLKDVVKRLKCFDKYSEKVKQEMARVISYDSFDDGRIIIRQGHQGYSFYFIIKGAVSVIISDTDKRGKNTSQVIGELTEGSSFGELALLHDIERTATIVCKGNSEFLRIDRADFDMVLRVSYEYEWNARLKALKTIPWFKDLSEEELLSANHVCKMLEYPMDKIVYGNTTDLTENVYYVVSGEAKIVREMYMIKEALPWGRKKITLKAIDHLRTGKRHQQRKDALKEGLEERHLIAVCTISKGHFYGLGEDLISTYIISTDRLEVLAVPRILFTRYGKAELLIRMKEDLCTVIPSNKQAFNHFMESKKWKRYKSQVTREVVSNRRIPNPTRLGDVPLAIRMEEPTDDLGGISETVQDV